MAGVPYEGTEGAEAGEWFDGVTKFEEEIRERVAELRQARMDLWNNSHLDAPVYLLGDMVWYRHPVERSGSELRKGCRGTARGVERNDVL